MPNKRKIHIIHPTRGRINHFLNCHRSFVDSIGNVDYRYYISIDNSDTCSLEYERLSMENKIISIKSDNSSCIEAVNNAIKKIVHLIELTDIIIVISDDFSPCKNWGEHLINATENKKDYLLKTYDGAEGWIVTLPILDVSYYQRFGYIYNPIYKHLFCDTELTHIAEILDRLIVRNDIEIRQFLIQDEMKSKTNNTWADGEKIYINRVKGNFGLSFNEIKKTNVSYIPHLKWLDKKMKEYE